MRKHAAAQIVVCQPGKHHLVRVSVHFAAALSLQGLGKTVQVIAMVCHLVETRGASPPFLIAAPASVLPNWAAELARWAPGLRVVQYKGSAEEREEVYYSQVCT